MSISSICVSLLLCLHVLTHISLILSFLLVCLISPLACSVFCSCPVLSDFAQTRLALGKGSPESALSTPGSPHHEYIMIRLPRQHFLSQRPMEMASIPPHFWSSIRRQTLFHCHFNSVCMLLVNKGTAVLLYLRSYLQEACFVYNLLSIVFFSAYV